MIIYPPHNLKPRINLGRTLDKNPANSLVRPMRVLAKLVTKTSNKMWESRTYDETINGPIDGNR